MQLVFMGFQGLLGNFVAVRHSPLDRGGVEASA
jgi:hypothetical protein